MKNLTLYIDLAICLLVLPLVASIYPVERWSIKFPLYVLSLAVWLYGLYAVNRRITVPCFFGRRHVVQAAVIIALSFAGTYLLSQIQPYSPPHDRFDDGTFALFPDISRYQQMVWTMFVIVEAFSFAVGLMSENSRQRSCRLEVEAERDRALIQLYKARIKPHFMFNTLNSLYGLFLTGDPKAMTSLEKYIDMIRYINSSTQADMVPLSDEAKYIAEFVHIQSLRLPEHTKVSLHLHADDPGMRVPPMLLVTFVENCFKHGVSSDTPGHIDIDLNDGGGSGILTLVTGNDIFTPAQADRGEHHGIENCRRRLQLHYPGRHRLDITNDGTRYEVRLSIRGGASANVKP